MELRYGILSTSSIAPRFIAAVRECGKGSIVALSSRTLEKAREKAELWDIPTFYGSHQELLQDKNVNIVYISNVNTQHYPWAKAALLSGKHVICEKPCTTTEDLTRELYQLAKKQGLFFMEAQKMLFLPAVLAAKERLSELGTIQSMEMSHSFPATYNGWMFDESAGGGPLLSSGIYAVELVYWLFGKISHIGGTADLLPTGVEYQYTLTGKTESGVLFTAQNSTREVLENTCRIIGEKGSIELPNYWKANKVIFRIGEDSEILEYPCRYELMYEAGHIADCLEKGLLNSPVVTEDISLAGIRAIQQAKANWNAK